MNPTPLRTAIDIGLPEAQNLLKNAKNILLAPSTPDGDSIGSALALKNVLTKLGKQVTVICTQNIPLFLQFLPGTHEIETEFHASKDFVITLKTDRVEVDHLKYEVEPGELHVIITPKQGQFKPEDLMIGRPKLNFDLIITVDTGDLVQLAKLYEENKDFFENTPLLNIDHHSSNGRFGSHNFLDFKMSSTTQMLTNLILELEKESGQTLIDEDTATLLLTGLVTDTGSFQHSNTTPEAFEVAADLLDRGARQQEIIKHIFKTKSLATLKLWGRVLSKMVAEGPLVYSTVTLQDLVDTGANSEDTGGIIDELMASTPGAEVVFLLKEKEAGFINGSMRAPGHLADVSAIAGELGGGGHKKAAGFRIKDRTMEEAVEMAKQAVFGHLLKVQPAVPSAESDENRLFPGLAARPTSLPKPAEGGEDMLLEDFKKRQEEVPANADPATRFFQDADAQVKPAEPTVGDVLPLSI